jgi:hypothetical protein
MISSLYVSFLTKRFWSVLTKFEVLQNPEVKKLFDSAKEFGHQKGTSAFATDVVQKIDHPTTQHGIHSIGIYTVPAHLSLDEYGQKFHRVVENFLALPAVKKNLLKYELVR